ncbi:MAG: aldolase [Phycisphaerae bacterium]|jgi:4-hydroxy-2-oxoheptanedioate aldolase
MRKSVIKGKLSRGEPVLLTQLHLTDPSVFELASLMGFDGLWMDLEHHTYSLETAAGLMRAARVGKSDIMARPAKGEFPRVARLLEAGAQGIMYPRCDSADEAREVVNWAKFAPLGKRGVDGGNPDMPYCSMAISEYIQEANRETFLVIQLEEERAVEAAEQIAAVPGVDVIFLGPGDFSVLSGISGQFDHPRVLKARDTIAQAARKAGIHWGCPAFSLEHARSLIEAGARFICYSADILFVKQGLERMQEQFGPLGFRFANRLNGHVAR